MINRIFVILLLAIFGSTLSIAAQSNSNLKARITLHNSIFEKLDEPGKSQFKSEEKIFARLELTNESSEEIGMAMGQQWRYIRPRLERNRTAIPYKAEIQNLLNEGSPLYSPLIHFTLKPKMPTATDQIYFDYWYDKLEPGHYTISIERLWMNQNFVTNQIEFDIVP